MPKSNPSRPGEEVRCAKCDKLLAKGGVSLEHYEIKCVRCGTMNPLFKHFVDQVIITDPEGKILYVNSQIEKVTGYTVAEALGRTPALWGRQMSPQFYRRLWNKIKTRKEGVSVTLTNRRKDGVLYQAHLRISPVLGPDNEVKMYVGIETVIRRQS